MSDTLADLASWLPSEFLTDDRPLYLNSRNPHRFPYDVASSSSTESESDDEDVTGFTRRFTRSVSLQERIKTPYHLEKRGFSGSPVSTLNSNVYGPTQSRSSPTTPFVQADEDAWHLIYAAAGRVARLKMKSNLVDDGVFGNRGVPGVPRPPIAHQHHPNCAIWRSETEEFVRQQQFRLRFAGCANYGGGGDGRCGGGRPEGFRQPAWPSIPVKNQRRQQPPNGFVVKPVIGGSGACWGRRTAVVKRECAGTGVFLPRRYPNDPPELKKKPACPPAQLPASVAQSFNKNMDPINGQPQPNIHGGFGPHYQLPPALPHHLERDELAEMVIARRNGVMLAQHRRSTTHEAQEVVLPQEWIY